MIDFINSISVLVGCSFDHILAKTNQIGFQKEIYPDIKTRSQRSWQLRLQSAVANFVLRVAHFKCLSRSRAYWICQA